MMNACGSLTVHHNIEICLESENNLAQCASKCKATSFFYVIIEACLILVESKIKMGESLMIISI